MHYSVANVGLEVSSDSVADLQSQQIQTDAVILNGAMAMHASSFSLQVTVHYVNLLNQDFRNVDREALLHSCGFSLLSVTLATE